MRRSLTTLMLVGGSAALAAVSFLHWESALTFWQLIGSLHLKMGIGAAVLATVALSLVAWRRPGGLRRLDGAVGLFAGGGVVLLALYVSSYHPKAADYIALALGVVITAGALLVVIDDGAVDSVGTLTERPPRSESQPHAEPRPQSPRRAAEAMQQPKRADLTEPVAPSIPAGWYPDPSGEHAERLWDGTAWTHEVR